jgi:hypothetical protein
MAQDPSRIERLEQQQRELAEKIRREKAKLRKEEQEREKRRQTIAGALVLKHAPDAPEVQAWLDRLLDDKLTENRERTLFGLTPKADPAGGAD